MKNKRKPLVYLNHIHLCLSHSGFPEVPGKWLATLLAEVEKGRETQSHIPPAFRLLIKPFC